MLTQSTDNQPDTKATSTEATPGTTAPLAETTPDKSADVAIPKWRAALPEDIRGEKMFDNIKGESWDEVGPVLAKGFHGAQKLVGGSLGKLPDTAKPDEVAKWKEANLPKLAEAGLIDAPPADPTKYTAKVIKDGTPVELPEGTLGEVYKEFHAIGLSDKQAQAMLDLYTRQQAQLGGTVSSTMEALKKEWGAGAPDQIKSAQRAAAQVGGSELLDVLEQTGLGNHPALIKMFARVGAMLAEDDPVFRDTVRTGADSAKADRDKILKDKNHAYWQKDVMGHKEAVAEVARLNQIIFAQEG